MVTRSIPVVLRALGDQLLTPPAATRPDAYAAITAWEADRLLTLGADAARTHENAGGRGTPQGP
ncbi:hypothetical protein ACFWSF_40640, partial [Streptomyces sp. NPDC058611]|uniref:hypothetical protein n=1 Tax=unclassified Streptomyces TaxID=2593676 RepID=UPI0036557EEC